MSTAASLAPLPLYREGLAFWEELTSECRQRMESINATALANGLPEDQLVEWSPGRGITLVRDEYPSTEIKMDISFERWGPTIKGTVKGYQRDDLRFYPEEFEVPLSVDLDDGIVAVLGEGRSLSPRELACYVTQNLRRSFPGMSLPCPDVN